MIESFVNNKYRIGVFIGLSQAFNTKDHSILLKAMNVYGITAQSWMGQKPPLK